MRKSLGIFWCRRHKRWHFGKKCIYCELSKIKPQAESGGEEKRRATKKPKPKNSKVKKVQVKRVGVEKKTKK